MPQVRGSTVFPVPDTTLAAQMTPHRERTPAWAPPAPVVLLSEAMGSVEVGRTDGVESVPNTEQVASVATSPAP